jgi:hypothetical protein
VTLDRITHRGVVDAQKRRPRLITHRHRTRGGPHDVGVQHGDELARDGPAGRVAADEILDAHEDVVTVEPADVLGPR